MISGVRMRRRYSLLKSVKLLLLNVQVQLPSCTICKGVMKRFTKYVHVHIQGHQIIVLFSSALNSPCSTDSTDCFVSLHVNFTPSSWRLRGLKVTHNETKVSIKWIELALIPIQNLEAEVYQRVASASRVCIEIWTCSIHFLLMMLT